MEVVECSCRTPAPSFGRSRLGRVHAYAACGSRHPMCQSAWHRVLEPRSLDAVCASRYRTPARPAHGAIYAYRGECGSATAPPAPACPRLMSRSRRCHSARFAPGLDGQYFVAVIQMPADAALAYGAITLVNWLATCCQRPSFRIHVFVNTLRRSM